MYDDDFLAGVILLFLAALAAFLLVCGLATMNSAPVRPVSEAEESAVEYVVSYQVDDEWKSDIVTISDTNVDYHSGNRSVTYYGTDGTNYYIGSGEGLVIESDNDGVSTYSEYAIYQKK